MHTTCDSHNSRQRSDLRTLDRHESWRGVYALLEVDQSIEPTDEQREEAGGAHA